MPKSQFDSPGTLRPDGTIQLTGTVGVAEPVEEVEIRFLLVQDDIVVEGKGRGSDGT